MRLIFCSILLSGALTGCVKAQEPEKQITSPNVAAQNRTKADRAGSSPESFQLASLDSNDWTILDVQPVSARDTKVRLIHAYPACGTYRVRETDYTFENVPVSELAGDAALCMPDKAVTRTIKRYLKKNRDEWLYDLRGTMAQCGTEKIVHRLPSRNDLRPESFLDGDQAIMALWEVQTRIVERFQKQLAKEQVNNGEQPADEQFLAKHAAIQIRNGDFDMILPEMAAEDGNIRLSDVMPDPETATSSEQDYGIFQNVSELGVETIKPIPYPQMGRIAHITGDVRVLIDIDDTTGLGSPTALTGHPILQYAAIDAIKQWRFPHPYTGVNPIEVVAHFEIHCPLVINTQRVSHPQKKRRQKKTRLTQGEQ
jgi:Gram-negative bacterial TonB protein C-terminal